MIGKQLLIRLIAFLALATALLGARQAAAQQLVTISIDPPAPTSQDVISVTVAGDLGEQHCTLDAEPLVDLDQHQVVILITETAQFCIEHPTTFSLTEQVGPLPPGDYHALPFNQFYPALNGVHTDFTVTGGAPVGGVASLPPPLATSPGPGLPTAVIAAIAASALALAATALVTRRRLTG